MDQPHSAPRREATNLADAELLLRARTGDTEAFGHLWRRHYRSGIVVARSITTKLDADDLVQEAFTRIFQSVQKNGGPTGSFRAYLFTTIRNTAAGWGRARRETAIDELDHVADPAVNAHDTDEALDRSLTHRAFRSLPTRWQEVLWYSEIEGMKPAEIAPLLGLKPTAVAQLTFRAREGLREAWIQAHLQAVDDGSPCQWSVERLGAYARGNLSKRDTAKLEAHLAVCTRCTIVASEAEQVQHRLALILLPLVIGATGATAYLASLQSGSAPLATLAAGATPSMPDAVVAPGADAVVESGADAIASGMDAVPVGAGTGGARGAGGAGGGGGAGSAGGASAGTLAGAAAGSGLATGAGTVAGLVVAGIVAVAATVAAATIGPQLFTTSSDSDPPAAIAANGDLAPDVALPAPATSPSPTEAATTPTADTGTPDAPIDQPSAEPDDPATTPLATSPPSDRNTRSTPHALPPATSTITGEPAEASDTEPDPAATPDTEPEPTATVPDTDPALPDTDPAVPDTDPAVPDTDPAVPDTDPTSPGARRTTPVTDPATADGTTATTDPASATPATEPTAADTEPTTTDPASATPATEPTTTDPASTTPATEPTTTDTEPTTPAASTADPTPATGSGASSTDPGATVNPATGRTEPTAAEETPDATDYLTTAPAFSRIELEPLDEWIDGIHYGYRLRISLQGPPGALIAVTGDGRDLVTIPVDDLGIASLSFRLSAAPSADWDPELSFRYVLDGTRGPALTATLSALFTMAAP